MDEVLRQEKKYLITLPDARQLSRRLSEVMRPDQHNGNGGYWIRSLYFDTLDDDDFWDKADGTELRRKIRLRCYDPTADFAMLEMKQKEGAYQKKRSLRLSREDAARLARGDYAPLLAREEPFAQECYGLMRHRCYRPRAVVEYTRQAYIAKENRIRVTIDSRIVATEACFDLFSPKLLQCPVLDPFHAVLEVKFNGFLLSYVKQLAGTADRSEYSVSKYCMARGAGLYDQL